MPAAIRKVFFWTHLTAGLIGGTVILIMSATGAVLALEPNVLRFVERDQRTVAAPAAGVTRLGTEALLARVLTARPDARPSGVTMDADPQAAVLVSLGRDIVYVDPYTGRITGEGAKSWRSFFRATTDWHRWLALSGPRRETGRAVTGACNAAFLFLALSGLLMWWPAQWTSRYLRPIVWFQTGLSSKARDFNWHNVIGFWSSAVLTILTFTGMTISYPAVGNLLYEFPQPPGGGAPRGERPSREGPPRESQRLTPEAFRGYDLLMSRAQAQLPGWTLVSLRFPARPGAPVTATLNQQPIAQPVRPVVCVARSGNRRGGEVGALLRL